jgi:uncharacterized protein
MSELLKIEPSSLGVGMYQKDISASDIKPLAEKVADSCVHFAGVDANTAGVHLLRFVLMSRLPSCKPAPLLFSCSIV